MPPRRTKKQRNEDPTSVPESQSTKREIQVSEDSKSGTGRVRKSGLKKTNNPTGGNESIEWEPEASIIDPKGSGLPVEMNTSGLATLPPELLSEIISYLPRIHVPFDTNQTWPHSDDQAGSERLVFLRALSQTCRSLRNFALPLCWETIEAVTCDSETWKDYDKWEQALPTELIRQLEIVTVRDPSLAQYVKVVNVLMTPWCINGVIKELARCLARFPNLHTLRIFGSIGAEYQTKFRAFFSKLKLLGVRTLTICVPAGISVMNACPNLVNLAPFIVGSHKYRHKFPIQDMGDFPHLEQIGLVELHRPEILGVAVQKFPRLKIVDLVVRYGYISANPELNRDTIPDCLELMRQLENLHCIRIFAGWRGASASVPSHTLAAARALLRSSPRPVSGSHKCVILVINGIPEHYVTLGKEALGEHCPYILHDKTPAVLFTIPGKPDW